MLAVVVGGVGLEPLLVGLSVPNCFCLVRLFLVTSKISLLVEVAQNGRGTIGGRSVPELKFPQIEFEIEVTS